MIRRVAREMVLQSLFQMDFTQAEPDEALAIALEVQQDEENSEEAAKAVKYAEKVLKGTAENLPEIDALCCPAPEREIAPVPESSTEEAESRFFH